MKSSCTRQTWFLAALLACCGSGCATVHQSPLEANLCAAPQCARDNVYPIFVASPVDFMHIGGIDKLRDYYYADCGCCNAELFQLYFHGGSGDLAERVRQIKSCNPCARVMLTGFSSGCKIIHDALCELEEDGVCVEGVCYIDSFTLRYLARDPHPNNVGWTSLVYRRDNPPPEGIPRSSVYYIDTYNHFDAPTHPRTVHVVTSHLCSMSGAHQ